MHSLICKSSYDPCNLRIRNKYNQSAITSPDVKYFINDISYNTAYKKC